MEAGNRSREYEIGRQMSLTSILKHVDFKELREKFAQEFVKPAFNLTTEIKAPPLTNNYGIVGTAFDYLMRFYLQHHNQNTFVERDTWVADHSYKSLSDKLSQSQGTVVATGLHRDKIYQTKDLLKIIDDQFKQAKNNYKEFITHGLLSDELIANTIFLAKLDAYYRAGIVDSNFDYHSPDDIKDIRAMLSLVDRECFSAKNKCYFNPVFGEGSMLVGGADADLIIDDTLIDIKATKHLKLDRQHFNQILGYYILSLIGGINQSPKTKPIKNIGIYFARHGELWTIPLSQFGDQQKFYDFKDWFIEFIKNSRLRTSSITIVRPYETKIRGTCFVKNNLLPYKGNFYSLPVGSYHKKGTEINYVVDQRKLIIYDKNGVKLCQHKTVGGQGVKIIKATHKLHKSINSSIINEMIADISLSMEDPAKGKQWMLSVCNTKPRLHMREQLVEIKSIVATIDRAIVDKAVDFCINLKFNNGFIFKSIAESMSQRENSKEVSPSKISKRKASKKKGRPVKKKMIKKSLSVKNKKTAKKSPSKSKTN